MFHCSVECGRRPRTKWPGDFKGNSRGIIRNRVWWRVGESLTASCGPWKNYWFTTFLETEIRSPDEALHWRSVWLCSSMSWYTICFFSADAVYVGTSAALPWPCEPASLSDSGWPERVPSYQVGPMPSSRLWLLVGTALVSKWTIRWWDSPALQSLLENEGWEQDVLLLHAVSPRQMVWSATAFETKAWWVASCIAQTWKQIVWCFRHGQDLHTFSCPEKMQTKMKGLLPPLKGTFDLKKLRRWNSTTLLHIERIDGMRSLWKLLQRRTDLESFASPFLHCCLQVAFHVSLFQTAACDLFSWIYVSKMFHTHEGYHDEDTVVCCLTCPTAWQSEACGSVRAAGPASMKKSKSSNRGTKTAPLCTYCHCNGHYASSCPELGKKLLSLLQKKHSSDSLQKFLAEAENAEIVGVQKRGRRTLKRAKGNRHFRARAASESGAQKKSRRGKNAKEKNRARDAIRRPRSRQDKAQQPAVTRDSTQKAYALLKKLGWCWKPTACECGGTFELLSFAHSQRRGHGRRFVRCNDCETYKDVMTWSHLPKLRLPLPSLVEAMKIWFTGSVPPSSDQVGCRIGVCGQNKSSLKTLLDTLASHEAALARDLQSRTSLSGVFF